jgi:haloalkane dehalogenase
MVVAGTRFRPPRALRSRTATKDAASRLGATPPTVWVAYSPAVQAYRTPDEQFAGLPDWPYAPRYSEQDGLRLYFADEGAGDPVLLLHGEPTWGFLYRRLVPVLGAVARVVVPDYFGFGRSDKPLLIEDYSYDFHFRSIERLVVELALRRLTVVVQDWGGPIGLRLAVERPELVDRLVLLNTGIGAGRAPSPEWLRFRDFVRRVGDELVASRLIALSLVGSPSEAVLAGYDAPFPVPEAKAGMLAFPELVPTELDHPSAAAMLGVRDALGEWRKPALVLFSDSDPIFSPAHAERLAARIPGAGPAEIVAGAGHFLQEDKGEEVAARIVRFLAET